MPLTQVLEEGKGRSKKMDQGKTEEDKAMYKEMRRLASQSAVVVFGNSDCCMCHVAKQLLIGLGVAPTVVDLDLLDKPGGNIRAILCRLPAVFVGGMFLGGIESLMACHINGSLVPILKEAGALWL
ncbi:hypothetical protein Nepgr_003309 [Nepenthes gracilis]|uniref:Glutaredoxin domain-containing protein n=1 Tax=Nepenthes gracilis TaxID=150966 RepID=A0AAD3XDM1_NEPGR|nr:hypothetical protein Nepgr_003309 [Nepenthes gracilis]